MFEPCLLNRAALLAGLLCAGGVVAQPAPPGPGAVVEQVRTALQELEAPDGLWSTGEVTVALEEVRTLGGVPTTCADVLRSGADPAVTLALTAPPCDPFSERVGTVLTERFFEALAALPRAGRAGRRLWRATVLATPPSALTAAEGQADSVRAVAAWWRGRDPLPATPQNERVVTHLVRVRQANDRYAERSSPTGLDGRGEVFVRLGIPDRVRTVAFDAADFQRTRRNRGLPVSRTDFPRNEAWAYEGLGRHSYFLFVERRRGGYQPGEVNDLLPRRLRNGVFSNSQRGEELGDFTMAVLRYALTQLASFHPDFGARSTQVSNYLAVREGDLVSSRIRGRRPPRPPGSRDVGSVVRSALDANEFEDEQNAASRDEVLPASRAPSFEGAPGLVARVSRFLDPEGRTELVVDWLAEAPGAGRAPVRGRRDSVTVVRYGADYATAVRSTVAYGEGTLRVRAGAGDPLAHVAVQREVVSGQTPVTRAVRRRDSLAVLRDGPLEVSDLRPLRTVGREPYPSDRVTPDVPLSVYFEIYGLDAVAGGRFTVEYEVTQRKQGGLLRRDRLDVSGGRLVSRTDAGRASEYLILNTADWAGADEVEVRVQVQAGRGRPVERSVRFDVGGGRAGG